MQIWRINIVLTNQIFMPFDDEYLNKTKVTNTRSQVIFTLGYALLKE